MPETLLIRADGGARIGTGHVMRCLALAQGWQARGGRTVFAQAASTPALEKRLSLEGIHVVRLAATPGSEGDAAKTVDEARKLEVTWVVADGYEFGAEWQKQVKDAGLRLLFLDDYAHAEHYSADLILNQNLHATEALYSQREPHTRLLLGPRFVQLRREFLPWRSWQRETPAVARKVLVTLGGSDPENVTTKVTRALEPLKDLEITVVVGGSNAHLAALQSLVSKFTAPVRLVVDPPNMPELMAWADVAVSSGGTTAWELAFMGLPSVIGQIGLAEEKLVAGLARLDLFARPGWFRDTAPEHIAASLTGLLNDPVLRNKTTQKARKLIDGRGADRVIALLNAARQRRTKKELN